MSLNLSISRLGLSGGGGNPPAFNVSFTGLSTDSLGNYGQVGNHAAISYTITPDLTTETVKWSNSSNPADAATFGTGASPTDFASVDGFSVYLHVTDDPGDGPVTRTFSFSARKAPATGGTDLDLSFPELAAITATDLVQNWTLNGNTLTYVSLSPTIPPGLSIDSAGEMTGTPTTDTADATYTLTMEDEYGREVSDTFTLEITVPPVLTLISDELDQAPPTYTLNSDTAGTLRWDFHSSATPPAAGAGDIATGTESVTVGENPIVLELSAYGGQTGYLHFRIGGSNILTSQQITVPVGSPTVTGTTGSPTVTTGQTFNNVTGTVYKFESSGSFTISGSGDIYFLAVAGGGAGGCQEGGGGGGGGMLGGETTSTLAVSDGTYTVTVGAGGPSHTTRTTGASGGNSDITQSSVSVIGGPALGGGGGGANSSQALAGGGSGGSGGGGGGWGSGSTNSTGGAGTAGQGNNGGASYLGDVGGGGGGAGGAGTAGSISAGGNGGSGRASSITGSSVTYAGGGGGSRVTSGAGAGGTGGGGAGSSSGAATAGTNGLGGGGGGSADTAAASGAGGSGVVIIFVPD